jgi:hypothetical protein
MRIWMLLGLLAGAASPCLAEDPCGYVTKAEISDLAGFQVDVVTPQTFPGSTACVYGAKTRTSVQVRTYTGKAAEGTEALCKAGAPVSGIGDKACITGRGPAKTLVANKGTSVLMVVLFNPQKPDADKVLEQIARKALTRL